MGVCHVTRKFCARMLQLCSTVRLEILRSIIVVLCAFEVFFRVRKVKIEYIHAFFLLVWKRWAHVPRDYLAIRY